MPNINTKNPISAETTKLAAELSALKEKSPLQKNASVFRLNLNHRGEIDENSLTKLIEAARSSKTYQRNKEKYQFTLVSGPNKTKHLALKQQGLWSKFKSLFPSTRAARQERRADAARIVLDSLGKFESDANIRTRAQARAFQLNVINSEYLDQPRTMTDLLGSDSRISEQLLPAGNGQQHRSDRPVSDGLVGSQKKPDYLKGALEDPYDEKFRENSIYGKQNKSVVSDPGFVNKDYEDAFSEDEYEKYEATDNQLKFFEQFLLSQLKTNLDHMTKEDD